MTRAFEPKSEKPNSRKPKEARIPKAELNDVPALKKVFCADPLEHRLSGFGIRISFGFRISNFGFRVHALPKPLELQCLLRPRTGALRFRGSKREEGVHLLAPGAARCDRDLVGVTLALLSNAVALGSAN